MIDYQNSHEIQRITNPFLLGFLLKQKILALKNHAGFMRYFKNSAWMLGEQMLRMIAGLLVGVWVARYLGPEQFGTFSYVMAFSLLFSSIAKLGLDNIVIQEIVNHPDEQDIYLSTAFWLKILSALMTIILVSLILPWTNNDNKTNLYILIIISGLIFQSFEVVDFYFQSQTLAKIISICKIIQLSLSSLVKIYLVFTDSELVWFIVVTLLDQISLTISFTIAYQLNKRKTLPLFNFDYFTSKILLKRSYPLLLSSIVVIIYMRVDQIIIKEIFGEYKLGIYSSAMRLTEIFSVIPGVISTSVFPSIIKAKKNPAEYQKRLNLLYFFLFWTAIIISILVSLFSEEIIKVIYGVSYKESSNVLRVLIWSNVFIFIGIAAHRWFIIEDLQKITTLNTVIASCLSITLNVSLISSFGIIGSAYITVISHAIAAYFLNLLHKKTKDHFYKMTSIMIKNPYTLYKG